MQRLEWFKRKILEHCSRRRADSYHNISLHVKNFLGKEPSQKEQVLAQKALKELINDSLIYDTNGQMWYGITDEGRKVLSSKGELSLRGDAETLIKNYDFHPKVKAVSLELVDNGHYKEAIQAALVEVIIRVKQVAGYPKNNLGRELDGDLLMQKAFGCDGENMPLIKLNPLHDSLDKAEQRGFMYLFKGIVGIRDKKAHLNFIQNDPHRTIEYLSLASLLMRLLEDNFLRQFS